MKKNTHLFACAMLLGLMGSAYAQTGTISFTGTITGNTCNVIVDGQGSDATITLPSVGRTQLANAADTAGRTGFNMQLSGCTQAQGQGQPNTVSAFFEAGSSVDLGTGRLKNMSPTATAATNVQLQLLDGSGNYAAIDVGNSDQTTNTTYVDIDFTDTQNGIATMPYAVEYYATGATGAGTVTSQVVYSLQYQ